MSGDLIEIERRRLIALEAALIAARRQVAAAIVTGLDGNRRALEQSVGVIQAALTVMEEYGDVSAQACLLHAREAYVIGTLGRRKLLSI